jgi:hypothetical protein
MVGKCEDNSARLMIDYQRSINNYNYQVKGKQVGKQLQFCISTFLFTSLVSCTFICPMKVAVIRNIAISRFNCFNHFIVTELHIISSPLRLSTVELNITDAVLTFMLT